MSKATLPFIVSFLSAISSGSFAQNVPTHNCVEIGGYKACLVELGKEYTVTDRRDEEHKMTDCRRITSKSSSIDLYYVCRSWYPGQAGGKEVPYVGYNWSYFHHKKLGGTFKLIDSSFTDQKEYDKK